MVTQNFLTLKPLQGWLAPELREVYLCVSYGSCVLLLMPGWPGLQLYLQVFGEQSIFFANCIVNHLTRLGFCVRKFLLSYILIVIRVSCLLCHILIEKTAFQILGTMWVFHYRLTFLLQTKFSATS